VKHIFFLLFLTSICSNSLAGVETMPIHKHDLRNLIIETLRGIDLYSPSAVELLMGTAAQETHLGHAGLVQRGGGPARGIFQMEPITEKDLWDRIIKKRPGLESKIIKVCRVNGPSELHMVGNLVYQIIMARIKYWIVPKRLPNSSDLNGLAKYWKDYYNTYLGKGKSEEFIRNYKKYCL
jgi:hypothetical protein